MDYPIHCVSCLADQGCYTTWFQYTGKKQLGLKNSVSGAELDPNSKKNHIKYVILNKDILRVLYTKPISLAMIPWMMKKDGKMEVKISENTSYA